MEEPSLTEESLSSQAQKRKRKTVPKKQDKSPAAKLLGDPGGELNDIGPPRVAPGPVHVRPCAVNETPSIEGKPLLGLHLTITSIHDVDTTKGLATICFDADVFIKVQKDSGIKMECGKIPETKEEAIEELKSIFAESFLAAQVTTDKDDMSSDDWGDGILEDVIGGEMKFTVTQKVKLDLEDFPFDVQNIPLKFYQQYDRAYTFCSPARFWEYKSRSLYALPLTVSPSALISEEWELHPPLLHYELTDPRETISAYSLVTVTLKLSRKGTGYAIRFMSIMSMLSLCAILPLLIRPEMDAGGMLGYEIGLLFAVVAFQLLVSSFLPVTSVATILDKYAFFLFGYIFLSMAVITIGAYVTNEKDEIKFEGEIHAGWLFGLWCLCHVYFVFLVRRTFVHRTHKLVSRPNNEMPAYKVMDGDSIAVHDKGD